MKETDGRRNNHGTIGNKGGRPRVANPLKMRSLRANGEDWEKIKAYANYLKRRKKMATKNTESKPESI